VNSRDATLKSTISTASPIRTPCAFVCPGVAALFGFYEEAKVIVMMLPPYAIPKSTFLRINLNRNDLFVASTICNNIIYRPINNFIE